MIPGIKPLGLAVGAALLIGLYGASTGGATGDRVVTQVKRTVSCTTALGALQISAFASNPSVGSANVSFTTGNPNPPTGLLGMSSKQKNYGLSGACHRVAKRVALSHRGLTVAFVSHAGYVTWRSVSCPVTPRVLLRFVIGLDASGEPVKATLAVRTQPSARARKPKKSKPLGFVQWSPDQSALYASSACVSEQQ